jgi:Ca-activated chloride channel family protein
MTQQAPNSNGPTAPASSLLVGLLRFSLSAARCHPSSLRSSQRERRPWQQGNWPPVRVITATVLPPIFRLLVISALVVAVANETCSLPVALAAQVPQEPEQKSQPPQLDARDRIKITSNLVVLPVTVKDAAGNLLPGLQKNEFHIYDDGIEQTISVFTAESFPLSLVVLVDDDLKSDVAAQMVESLRAAAGGFGPEDEAMVCRYDLLFYPGSGFAHDFDALWKQLEDAQSHSGPSTSGPIPPVNTGRPINGHSSEGDAPVLAAPIKAGHRPTKALDDAVHSAALLLRDRGSDRRKLVLLISDGENGKQFNKHGYEDTLGELLRSNISVFSLAVGSNEYRKRFSRLVNYANDSGGDIYYAAASRSMERLYARITEEARHEYTLAYVPTGNSKRSAYHAVEVHVTRPGLTVKTRRGYTSSSANPPDGKQ